MNAQKLAITLGLLKEKACGDSDSDYEDEDPKTKLCSCGCDVIGGSCDKGLAIDNGEQEQEDEDPKDIYGKCSDCNEILVDGYWWSRPDRGLKFCGDCGGHILDEEETEKEKINKNL